MKLWVFAPLRAAALSGFKVGVSALCLALCFACGGCLRQAASAEWKEPVTGMQFVLIPPGRFVMGSPVGEAQREEQERQHETVITRAFYLGKFEVTQRQWEAVMGDNPSHFREAGGELPVERVTWYDVQEFLKRLSATGGVRYRLPTEAEWE
ncbi:MAG TPA: formylglycine-generating enzyme family protein, partial [Blastocatellia bacterium]|nr:formylglycine-generating enzyme family protein [Blastocatellia bacterium]